MAEVVLRAALDDAGLSGAVLVDSAGTGDWHLGQSMNRGALAALARRGYDGSAHRARRFSDSWFGERDLVLAMDSSNFSNLMRLGPGSADVRLFAEAGALDGVTDIPDPYGGGPADFDHVLDLLEAAAPVIAAQLVSVRDLCRGYCRTDRTGGCRGPAGRGPARVPAS
jgi:low molecular weight protein-tyrosine phosphatase